MENKKIKADISIKRSNKHTTLGVVVGVLALAYVLRVYLGASDVTKSSDSWYAIGGYIAKGLLRNFMLFMVLSGAACIAAYVSKKQWIYVIGLGLLIVAVIELPSAVGVPWPTIVLGVGMFFSFVIDNTRDFRAKSEWEQGAVEGMADDVQVDTHISNIQQGDEDMLTMSLTEFSGTAVERVLDAMNGKFCKVTSSDGKAAVIIDETEWTMLNQALKLCTEHPEWTENA